MSEFVLDIIPRANCRECSALEQLRAVLLQACCDLPPAPPSVPEKPSSTPSSAQRRAWLYRRYGSRTVYDALFLESLSLGNGGGNASVAASFVVLANQTAIHALPVALNQVRSNGRSTRVHSVQRHQPSLVCRRHTDWPDLLQLSAPRPMQSSARQPTCRRRQRARSPLPAPPCHGTAARRAAARAHRRCDCRHRADQPPAACGARRAGHACQ